MRQLTAGLVPRQISQQQIDQFRFDLDSLEFCRTDDRLHKLLACHRREQHRMLQSRGQHRLLGGHTERIRTQSDHHDGTLCESMNSIHRRGNPVDVLLEDLFELIDDDHVGVHVGSQRLSSQRRRRPTGKPSIHAFATDQTGRQQRRLAAARSADQRDEPTAFWLGVDQISEAPGLGRTSEVQTGVVHTEWTQPQVRRAARNLHELGVRIPHGLRNPQVQRRQQLPEVVPQCRRGQVLAGQPALRGGGWHPGQLGCGTNGDVFALARLTQQPDQLIARRIIETHREAPFACPPPA
ncbi:hypothetical protein SDC9_119901 [bioreactor metagenome]|uniref:Uncharacterized protein n=1 Tax=bioreactor metagenome TaxID=1076179 RepID=A0A645C5T9_9ZZZZ